MDTFIGVALIITLGAGFILWFVIRFLHYEEYLNRRHEELMSDEKPKHPWYGKK
jgi:hypothetical protein